jgi:hypothetical protein
MSTRSVVGTIDDAGTFRGRYVHSDGYPSWQGPALTRILARLDGDLPQMIRTVTTDWYGWSILDGAQEGRYDDMLGERGARVPGFGVAYTTAQGQSEPDDWTTFDPAGGFLDCFIEWAYGFTSADPATAELHVFVNVDETAREVVRVPVRDMHRTDWGRVERAGESLEEGPATA